MIGGVAAIAHGVSRITRDLDLIVQPSKANRRRTMPESFSQDVT